MTSSEVTIPQPVCAASKSRRDLYAALAEKAYQLADKARSRGDELLAERYEHNAAVLENMASDANATDVLCEVLR